MTEAEWLTCADPTRLMRWERIAATERQVRLLAVACCRRIPTLDSHAVLTAVIDTVERFADGQAPEEDLREANLRAEGVAERAGSTADAYESAEGVTGNTVREWRIQCAGQAAYWASFPGELRAMIDRLPGVAADAVGLALAEGDYDQAQVDRGATGERAVQADLFRDIFGRPFLPITFDPRRRSADVLGLATAVYDDRAFDRLPLLADALMDAGCAEDDILAHCRAEGPHVRGCWVVDRALGKVVAAEPDVAPDPRRHLGSGML